ncbi:MAG: MerR family DNA-binding transcriptional regulator [Gemmiger sp.]
MIAVPQRKRGFYHDDRKRSHRLTGISIRTLQYYDKLGLLPAIHRERLQAVDDAALERLQQILLFQAEFSLRDIRTILDNPNFDRRKACANKLSFSR